MVIHKTSLIMPLPASYQARIQVIPGVQSVTHNNWFGGIYQQPSNFFAQIALEPEPYFAMYPEYHLPSEQMKAWLADRQGAVVSRDLAERFGWKVGDRIPIQGTIYNNGKNGNTWEFNLVGIYDSEPGSGMNGQAFLFRYDYLDEARRNGIRSQPPLFAAKSPGLASRHWNSLRCLHRSALLPSAFEKAGFR